MIFSLIFIVDPRLLGSHIGLIVAGYILWFIGLITAVIFLLLFKHNGYSSSSKILCISFSRLIITIFDIIYLFTQIFVPKPAC